LKFKIIETEIEFLHETISTCSLQGFYNEFLFFFYLIENALNLLHDTANIFVFQHAHTSRNFMKKVKLIFESISLNRLQLCEHYFRKKIYQE